MVAELYIAFQGFGCTSMSCVVVKPSVKESPKSNLTRTAGLGSMLLDSFAERIGRLLSSIETALRNLDSLSIRSAAGKERVALGRFSVPPGAFCNRANHVVTS